MPTYRLPVKLFDVSTLQPLCGWAARDTRLGVNLIHSEQDIGQTFADQFLRTKSQSTDLTRLSQKKWLTLINTVESLLVLVFWAQLFHRETVRSTISRVFSSHTCRQEEKVYIACFRKGLPQSRAMSTMESCNLDCIGSVQLDQTEHEI